MSVVSKYVLLIVDPQYDFTNGSLTVPNAKAIYPNLNNLMTHFKKSDTYVSADTHSPTNKSFKDNGGTWPVHCVVGTQGQEFYKDLVLTGEEIIINKGENDDVEEYSACNAKLINLLKDSGATDIAVGGLATDYCVKATVLDLLKNGFKAHLILDTCAGVNINPDDSKEAIAEMSSTGAVLWETTDAYLASFASFASFASLA
jgi:nicotinamidase/pyrazinamidase